MLQAPLPVYRSNSEFLSLMESLNMPFTRINNPFEISNLSSQRTRSTLNTLNLEQGAKRETLANARKKASEIGQTVIGQTVKALLLASQEWTNRAIEAAERLCIVTRDHFRENLTRKTPYNHLEAETSSQLSNWNSIAEWRAEDKGNKLKKLGAQLAFFSGGIKGLTEVPPALAAAYIVGNPLSRQCARGISYLFPNYPIMQNYENVSKTLIQDFDSTVQGTAQHLASSLTNPFSHEVGMCVSKIIKSAFSGQSEKIAVTINKISPLSIYYAIRGKPTDLALDIVEIANTELTGSQKTIFNTLDRLMLQSTQS